MPIKWALVWTTLLCLSQANDPIDLVQFGMNGGLSVAQQTAPIWYFSTGSCLPSAAEDGQGHQTNGVNVPVVLCGIGQRQDGGCPQPPPWQGPNTPFRNPAGEPFADIPVYWKTQFCPRDNTWRVFHGLYFKHDVSHKNDWEWSVIVFRSKNATTWVRDHVLLEADGKYGGGIWSGVPNTFNDGDDFRIDGQRNKNRPKFFVSMHHHSMHWDPYYRNKNSCIGPDFRTNDYYIDSTWNLRAVNSSVKPEWNFGAATNPSRLDLCDNRGVKFAASPDTPSIPDDTQQIMADGEL